MPKIDSKPLPPFSEKDIERFWRKVARRGPDDCWFWTAMRFKNGYGRFKIARRVIGSHRIALFLASGEDPQKCACHSCDIRYPVASHEGRQCCNPAHLFWGTKGENAADRHEKGRDACGDNNGLRKHPERAARGLASGRYTHPERTARGDRHRAVTKPESYKRGNESWTRLHPERLARGEASGRAKLTADQVREIRRLSAMGLTNMDIGKRFGVTNVLVSYIVHRKVWKHIA